MTGQLSLSYETTPATLGLIAADPCHARDRAAVIAAIREAHRLHGEIDANLIREHIPAWVQRQVIGSTIGHLVRQRVLRHVGWTENEDKQGGNEGKPLHRYTVDLSKLDAAR